MGTPHDTKHITCSSCYYTLYDKLFKLFYLSCFKNGVNTRVISDEAGLKRLTVVLMVKDKRCPRSQGFRILFIIK